LNETIDHLNQKRIIVLANAEEANNPISAAERWKSNTELGLTGTLADDWNRYVRELKGAGIALQINEIDTLVWTGVDNKGELSVKNTYEAIFSLKEIPTWSGWKKNIWKWPLPLKMILFFWLAWKNKILTWEQLQRKGWVGPSVCCLCNQREENLNHLFITCDFTRSAWAKCAHTLKFNHQWAGTSLNECMNNWLLNSQVSKRIPIIICWFLWKERNKTLFEGHSPSTWAVCYKVLGAFNVTTPDRITSTLRQKPILIKDGYSVAYFDGAAIAGGSNCGAGGTIICATSQVFRWFLNCGEGTNTKAELLGAWGTLTLAKMLDLHCIQVMGDSKVIIDWLDQKGRLQAINIEAWKRHIEELIQTFQSIQFHHIFRETNKIVDQMSKRALTSVKGRLTYYTWDGEKAGPTLFEDIF
jgi:ribonuclease HI